MARSDNVPQAEPPRTRAEELRDSHCHQGKWYFPNSAPAPTEISSLYNGIQKAQETLAKELAEQGDVQAEYEIARRAKDRADKAVVNARDKLDILKLALSDALEIPK